MDSDIRKVLLIATFMAAAYVCIAAAMELMREAQRADIATIRADLAAWQLSELMEEARDITRQAANVTGGVIEG